ncbi:Oligodendrocyte transcription factor 3 [Mactra antiquata]
MSLSYNIDKLLEKNEPVHELVHDDIESNQSFSDNEEISDDEKSSPTNNRKYERRNKSRVPEDIRLRVNSRERQRMHDLNSALDGLRQALPYSHGPSVKKISKMATLVLARNYIVMLNKSLDEMKKLVTEMSMKQSSQTQTLPSVSPPTSTSPERLSTPAIGITPFSSNKMASHPAFSNGIHKMPAFSHVHPLYMPYRLSTGHHTSAVHGGALPACHCNFCKFPASSLPKPEWN